jgi:hypothetical protein
MPLTTGVKYPKDIFFYSRIAFFQPCLGLTQVSLVLHAGILPSELLELCTAGQYNIHLQLVDIIALSNIS